MLDIYEIDSTPSFSCLTKQKKVKEGVNWFSLQLEESLFNSKALEESLFKSIALSLAE
jgi:hypothetical protein